MLNSFQNSVHAGVPRLLSAAISVTASKSQDTKRSHPDRAINSAEQSVPPDQKISDLDLRGFAVFMR
jgi:hypothetical protein